MTQCQSQERVGYPAVEAMRLLEQKWSLQVLRAMAAGRQRFCHVQDSISGVNAVTLARRLRQMEGEGIVIREILNTIPPWVEYELTDKGRELNAIVEEVERWGLKWASQPQAVQQDSPAAVGAPSVKA